MSYKKAQRQFDNIRKKCEQNDKNHNEILEMRNTIDEIKRKMK